MSEQSASKFWLDQIADDIDGRYPANQYPELIIETGHSPSGRYHFGLFREFMTAHALVLVLRERGRAAKHIDFVDDFDALRKVPADIEETFASHLGKPLYLVPAPDGKAESYADYYLNELYEGVYWTGVEPEIIRSHQQYQSGRLTPAIELCLEHVDEIRVIIEKISQRRLGADWAPVQILSDQHSLRDWRFTGWDKSRQTVQYRAVSGEEGEIGYTGGRVKLDWRLDWPARWWQWSVNIEPFGRDHASAGGSYATGSALMQPVFGTKAPYPVPYDFVLLSGQTKKMSKSAGNIVTLRDILELAPPELIRYFMVRSRPNKSLIFDHQQGLYSLIEEYSKAETAAVAGENHEFKRAYQVAAAGKTQKTIASVPFSHLVTSIQAAQGDKRKVYEILKRTGFIAAVEQERSVLDRELDYVQNWLAKYAPEEVKFEVQTKRPEVKLTDQERVFLTTLAAALAELKPLAAQAAHEAIYLAAEKAGITPAEAFRLIYRLILNKDSGPKAGWFLASLDQAWLLKRLNLEA